MSKENYDPKEDTAGVLTPLAFAMAGLLMVSGSCINSYRVPTIDESCAGEQPQNMALCKRIYLGHLNDNHTSHK